MTGRDSYTILCVDDEASIRSALRRVFLDEDWTVLFAESGAQGLDVFQQNEVDLVLSDFRMPGMDGVEFLKRVKEIDADCVRIVLSGYADIGLVVSALNEGEIYRFLPKPWNDDELLDNIRKALAHHRLDRENRALADELRRLNGELEKKVEERTRALHDKNRRLRAARVILELLPTPIVGIDEDGLVLFANAKARAILDEDGTGLVGRPPPSIFEPELSGAIARARAGGNGSPRSHVLPMVFAGEAVGAVVLTSKENALELDLVDARDACAWSAIPL